SADSSDTSRGLRALVGPLLRQGLAEELVIPRLDPNSVGTLVKGILGGEAPVSLLQLLESRADGTPLFVEALVAALLESGDLVRDPSERGGWDLNADGATALPPSIRSLILERLERLALEERRLLGLIAVMGDATPHSLLLAAAALEEETFLESLQRLLAAGLVAENIDGSDVIYSMTHPLIQEVAYAELPEMVRRRAHIAAIKAIESSATGRPDDINRLASHYHGAGPGVDCGRALTVFLSAGERARSVFANERAARHYGHALALVREGNVASGVTCFDKPLLPWILERLGEVWARVGDGGAAIGVWNEALVLLSEGRECAGDAGAACRLRRQMAVVEWDRGNFDIANDHLRAGLASLADQEPCQDLADLHFVRFYLLNRIGDAAGVAGTAADLLSVADRLASPRVEAEAHLAASISCLWQSDIDGARQHALHALGLGKSFSDGPDLEICWRSHASLANIGMRLGDHRLMSDHAALGLADAQRLGVPNMEVYLGLYLALAKFMSGAWDESLRLGKEATSLARRVGYPRDLAFALANCALISSLREELHEAEACIRELRLAFSVGAPVDRRVFSLVDIAETALALLGGQEARALAIAMSFSSSSVPTADRYTLPPQQLPIGLMLLAEAQVAAGQPEKALETAHRLTALGPSGTTYLTALASRAEGLARQSLGQSETAVACLSRAHEAFTALDMPFEAARSLLEAAVSLAIKQPEAACSAGRQCMDVFERLGARRHAERTRRLLRGLGILPPRPPRIHTGGGLLSDRELEIAQLVAEGLTTPQIAKRLILSPLTVSTHLRRIYSRLGVTSRWSLTHYLTKTGLLPITENT
ncbi:MAG: LuxR C-terminal-related transcriptional regulator, partial [Dehalococcoidia bacterium]|nr:LuxR C-terminal-related transcriptional regulator [Dehalococcoidia bacterium]